MNFLSLLNIEIRKLKRSKILLILLASTIILWIPSIVNSDLNFTMQAQGISPEHNFFIQGFLAMTWFMFPASMVVCTVLLSQTERANKGIFKMLSLPVHRTSLCLAKSVVLLGLAVVQMLMMTGMYYISAVICSAAQNYNFILPPLFVAKEAGLLLLSAIPMIAFFWMLSVCIQTPIFSIGIGLASIIPSVLLINTKLWYIYPISYPLFIITAKYGTLASSLNTGQIRLIPWIPFAIAITIITISISCFRFGQAERR